MKWMLDIDIPSPESRIDHPDPILLIGSCFTEHIGNSLSDFKFNILQNPNGILFDPHSVASALTGYIHRKTYADGELFLLNGTWNSWAHHSRFSGVNKDRVLERINASQLEAHEFLKKSKWLVITLGTSFSYKLVENGAGVANCHRAPGQWFRKSLLTIEDINAELDNCIHQLFHFNPSLRIIFTVSPVRHIRDGVIENNRSKARLLEVIHHLVNKFDRLYYFPAYELVIDVLRDYRFYDIDLVHPNYAATQFVLEKFFETYISPAASKLAEELKQLSTAYRHRPMHPESSAHQQFLDSQRSRTVALMEQFPHLDLKAELDYFSGKAST